MKAHTLTTRTERIDTFLLKEDEVIKQNILLNFAFCVQGNKDHYRHLRHYVIIGRNRHILTGETANTVIAEARKALKMVTGEVI